MRILRRYIVSSMLQATALILLVLLALGGFVNFAAQVNRIGHGSYTLPDALAYVALSLPNQAFEMLPVAALLGGLLGLGALASNSELIVMRAAGVSVRSLGLATLTCGLILTLVAAALGEFIAPPIEQYAKRLRAQKLHKQLSFAGGAAGWIKDGNVVINIGEILESGEAGGIYIYRFDDDGRIRSIGAAGTASVSETQRWNLEDYRETEFTESSARTRQLQRATQDSNLSPDLLQLSVVDPAELSGRRLFDYVRYLKDNGLESDTQETALWLRFANIVSVMLMSVLSLPFVFGSLRAAGAGSRVLVGVLLGVAYFLGSKTLANSGSVYGLPPLLAAWAPTLTLALATLYLLSRIR